jgi:hypothetical protein
MVIVESKNEGLVEGDFARSSSATTDVLAITTARRSAVSERSTLSRALVTAIAVGSVLDTSILEALAETFRGAHGSGHRGRRECIIVEGTRASVIGVASLMDVFVPVTGTTGGGRVRRTGWSWWFIFV